MTEQTMSIAFDPNSVRKVVSVQAPQAVAWKVFTEKMGAWWPLAYYKIGKANAVDAVIEPHVGGRWYERGDDGSTCQWGSVLAWEPHSRLVLSWDINADWQYDPTLKTELELRFNADGSDRTLVELEHRHLDRFGARRDEMRRIFDKDGDWGKFLELFARAGLGEKNMSDIEEARKALVRRILEGDGDASHSERQAAFHNSGLPEPPGALVDKVARQAYRVTDEDITAARVSGLSEDQVFEIAVCAAIGQATRQYDTALAALAAATGTE